ncbi:hypothetical protein EDI_087080 [Entamoeba dispar SAW760]|uniref:Uncharacterized protein n=1 Tax=Entamoeba dispar (strain ATCC PRA-260 / SAW760) TaxID=370354 RepID=B0ELD8_ENTDS|nr:uncharacterized protein EDI_087080 [Entamoeba dispar SAW760]EDR24660.1 hypothetical protein EDI_087080 [Entamoeba dispar SAW760]|eukprot:EDR24660.1 hypothetical protein EDI_087080 [Entamoeba dispar SAW760]
MQFIGIIDPEIGEINKGLDQQITWCKQWANNHNYLYKQDIIFTKIDKRKGEDIDISSSVMNLIQLYLVNRERKYKTQITHLLFNNNVRHVPFFFECCHSGGLFQPDESCIFHTDRIIKNPTLDYHYNEDNSYSMWKSNITVFSTSLKEQRSYQLNEENKGYGWATQKISELEKSPFDYTPIYVVNWLNKQIGKEQYAIVQSSTLIPTWF